uniref:FXYD domain-containing ion transport regulator n=1 Tax=Panthera tigris altaica TaxID=74533 RepID=A0A8C9KZP1_PANTA
MREATLSLLILLIGEYPSPGLPFPQTPLLSDKNSPFYYGESLHPSLRNGGLMEGQALTTPSGFLLDWHRLRIGGLICAGVLCTIGIIVLMSGKCKCKFSQKCLHHPGDAPPLITPGSAHN